MSNAARVREQGYTVLVRLIAPRIEALKRAVSRIERDHDIGYAKTTFVALSTWMARQAPAFRDAVNESAPADTQR